ncbi:Uncharacterized protein APZ42_015446 [Daphnia magna]|uniref:Uncharacterized protein n=1 Tax=Daphnia magna TaxID=35525 RepID=A0A162PH14_9CRUS|nr:Uncharacterized protein APZ42_015446 [Daphnia magna]
MKYIFFFLLGLSSSIRERNSVFFSFKLTAIFEKADAWRQRKSNQTLSNISYAFDSTIPNFPTFDDCIIVRLAAWNAWEMLKEKNYGEVTKGK